MSKKAATVEHEGEGENLVQNASVSPNELGRAAAAAASIPTWLLLFISALVAVLMLLIGYLAGKEAGTDALRKHLHEDMGGKQVFLESTPMPTTFQAPPPQTPVQTPGPTMEHTDAPTLFQHKYDPASLRRAQKLAQNQVDALTKYYGKVADKVLLGDVGFGFGFTGKNGAPTNAQSFAHNVKLIARSLVHQEPLKLGFIGSSVMCGHDNCYYDSFPAQMERMIKPVFVEAGTDVVLRNACQGGGCGDNFANQIFCFRHMVGDDIDFLFYEWTYFETGGFEWQFHDAIARWAAMLPKAAATIIFSCGGNAWGRKSVEEAWAPFGSNSVNLEDGLREGVYKGKEWGAVGDGLHTTTRYGEDAGTSAARKKSLGVVFRNWHPGPLGLQYIADLTTYLLMRAMVQAIDEILAHPEPEKRWAAHPLDHPKMPPIAFTRADNALLYEVVSQLEEEPPGCLTVQAKTFARPIISVSDRTDDYLNPYRDHVLKVNSGSNKAWRLHEASVNWGMVPKEEQYLGEICQPPDRCAYFQPPTSLEPTPLVFRLPKMVVGLITLCGGDGESGKKWMSKRDSFVAEFDGKVLDKANYVVFPNQKCLTIQQKFTGPVENKNGHLYLSITTTDAEFKISQVITA